MKHDLSRRHFLATSAVIAAGLGVQLREPLGQARAAESAPGLKHKLYKALIVNRPSEDELKRLKDAGFDGVEAGIVSEPEAEKCRAAAEKAGMRIHAVLRGWAEFNHPDQGQVDRSFKTTEAALRAAHGFGADAVLLVPCRISGVKMPRPWEFLIETDETGHLTRVVNGDNAPYAEYIRAHNHAIDTSREMVKRLIPLAEETGVVIALENVWNNLWVKPAVFKQFVASFQSPWVKAYFDIGNHVKYAAPEEWILTLGGDLLAKCHVKDFKLSPTDPNGGGDFVNIRDGSVRWPVVRSALDAVGYAGWMTIEGGDLSVAEHSKRLDMILAGK